MANGRTRNKGDFKRFRRYVKYEVIDVNDPENDVENQDVPMIHHAVLFQKKKLNVLANKEEENVDIEALQFGINAIEQMEKGETANWIICCDGYYPFCSECRNEPPGREMSRYCPNCGRRMVTPKRRKAHG